MSAFSWLDDFKLRILINRSSNITNGIKQSPHTCKNKKKNNRTGISLKIHEDKFKMGCLICSFPHNESEYWSWFSWRFSINQFRSVSQTKLCNTRRLGIQQTNHTHYIYGVLWSFWRSKATFTVCKRAAGTFC